jgi:Lipocalin-like domain
MVTISLRMMNGLPEPVCRDVTFQSVLRNGEHFTMSVKDRMIGTWKLIGTIVEDLNTGEKSKAWGDDPEGFINYGPDGRMIVINTRAGRKKPAGAVPTPEEAAELFKTMLAYAGTYTVDGDVVTHHVDISWNEAWTGTDQVRTARFDGDRVHLSTAPSPDLASGKMSIRTMSWEKLK